MLMMFISMDGWVDGWGFVSCLIISSATAIFGLLAMTGGNESMCIVVKGLRLTFS